MQDAAGHAIALPDIESVLGRELVEVETEGARAARMQAFDDQVGVEIATVGDDQDVIVHAGRMRVLPMEGLGNGQSCRRARMRGRDEVRRG